MSHNSKDLTDRQNTPIATPLDCQPTARSRKSLASPLLGRVFCSRDDFFWRNSGSNWSRRHRDFWPDGRMARCPLPRPAAVRYTRTQAGPLATAPSGDKQSCLSYPPPGGSMMFGCAFTWHHPQRVRKIRNKPNFSQANCNQCVTVGSSRRGQDWRSPCSADPVLFRGPRRGDLSSPQRLARRPFCRTSGCWRGVVEVCARPRNRAWNASDRPSLVSRAHSVVRSPWWDFARGSVGARRAVRIG